MNIIEPILFHCRYHPTAPALCVPGVDIVTYARLEKQINNVVRRARSAGLKPGNIVALSIASPLMQAVLMLGLIRSGIVAVSAGARRLPPGLGVDAVLSDAKYPYGGSVPLLAADASWLTGDGKPFDEPTQAKHSALSHIVLTSGTSGETKAVGLSHDMLSARIRRHEFVFGNRLPTCSRILVNLGLGTALGGLFLLHSLWRGGTVFFPGAPGATLDSFETFGIQAVISAPNGLAQLLRQIEQYGSFQCRLQVIVSGGSLLSVALADRVRSRLCADLVSAYGSTETSMVAAGPAHALAHKPGAVGYVTPGVSVEIVDETGRLLPPGSEGNLRIASEYAVNAYMGDPAESARVFREGWFYPGDIASLSADKLLVISGREKDVLNVGGSKVNPERVEEVLTAFPGIVDAAVFGAPNRLGIEEPWAAIVSAGPLDEKLLRAHCDRELVSAHVPVSFLTMDSLPRNEMGKIDRRRLADMARPT